MQHSNPRIKKIKFSANDYVAKSLRKTSSSAETTARSVYDVTNRNAKSQIARDSVERNLHEPSIEELCEFYGISLEDL